MTNRKFVLRKYLFLARKSGPSFPLMQEIHIIWHMSLQICRLKCIHAASNFFFYYGTEVQAGTLVSWSSWSSSRIQVQAVGMIHPSCWPADPGMSCLWLPLQEPSILSLPRRLLSLLLCLPQLLHLASLLLLVSPHLSLTCSVQLF